MRHISDPHNKRAYCNYQCGNLEGEPTIGVNFKSDAASIARGVITIVALGLQMYGVATRVA
jgi:hypothetical protein